MHALCITFMYYFELLFYDPKTGDLYCYADEINYSIICYLIFYRPFYYIVFKLENTGKHGILVYLLSFVTTVFEISSGKMFRQILYYIYDLILNALLIFVENT